jgi:hypothetical protein
MYPKPFLCMSKLWHNLNRGKSSQALGYFSNFQNTCPKVNKLRMGENYGHLGYLYEGKSLPMYAMDT